MDVPSAPGIGIECYMQMKNLNKRLYQRAGTQPCLRLAGSPISGLTGACAAATPPLCFGRRLPAAGSPPVIWQAPMAQVVPFRVTPHSCRSEVRSSELENGLSSKPV